MKVLSILLLAWVWLSGCTVQYSNGQPSYDPNINCSGMTGQMLHRCAAIATGFMQQAMRDFDLKCQSRGMHMAMSRATHANRQIVICKPGRQVTLVANQPEQGSKTIASWPVTTNPSHAVRYGDIPKPTELAAKEGLPVGGGIKQGKVIVIPNDEDWDGIVARHNGGYAELFIKHIERGETFAQVIARGRRNGVRGFTTQGRIPVIPVSEQDRQDSCKFITDGFGELITLRNDEEGIHRYAYYHAINDAKYWFSWHTTYVDTIQKNLAEKERAKATLLARLGNNRAYQGKQCVSVPQRQTPEPPKRFPERQVTLNARGTCLSMLGSRFGEEKVITAIESAGRWDITQDYQEWVLSSNKMRCAVGAGITVPEFESLKCRGIDWLAPNLAKDYFYKCLRTDLEVCISDVKDMCDNGYGEWQRLRQRIISEPANLKSSCEQDTTTLETLESEIASLKRKLDKALKDKNAAFEKQKAFTDDMFIPFSDQRTYCEL